MLKVQSPLLLLFNLVFLQSEGQNNNCDSIPWSNTRLLTWSDFKALPDTASSVGALSHNSIKYILETVDNNYHLFALTYFDPCTSWYKPSDSTLSLEHEQTHFDIDEYIRRSFIKDVLSLNNFSKYAVPGVSDIYFSSMISRKLLQRTYDLETNFHRNNNQQKLWSSKIIKIVQELDNFAAYNFYIKKK